jgi:hypothetical protein
MSITLMSRVWGLDLTQNEKLVLLALADHADDDGFCFPSIRRLAWKTDYSERSIQRIIRKLQGDGVVEVAKEAPGTPGRPRVYLLNLERASTKLAFDTGANMSPLSDERVTPLSQTGDKSSATGDTGDATGDIAVAPESSVESSEEPSSNRAEKSKSLSREGKCKCGTDLDPGNYCPSCNAVVSLRVVS